jgi:hypothetical protein
MPELLHLRSLNGGFVGLGLLDVGCLGSAGITTLLGLPVL